jgi:polygalacturonase
MKPRFLLFYASLVLTLASCIQNDIPDPTPPPAANNHIVQLHLIADGKTNQALPLQKAIDSCSAAGGGTLVLPKGTYMITPIYMRSNVNLQLDTLSTLLASPAMSDFTTTGKLLNLINGDSLHNVSITGKGTIDGSGAPWWLAFQQSGVSRPRLVYITRCVNLTVDGVTLTNSPSFHLVPNQCQNVVINNVKIISPATSPNTDGIDPSNCQTVSITNCSIDVGDDCIAIKSGRINNLIASPSQDITVTGCTFLHGHGLSIGSETSDGVKNLTVNKCTFTGTTNGIRLKSAIGLGGLMQNLHYSNIVMSNVTNPIVIDLAYSLNPNTNYPTDIPAVDGLYIDNLTVTGAKNAGSLVGLSNSILQNINLSNINITAQTGLVLTNANNVSISNSVIKVSSGKPVIATNTQGTGF